MLGAIYIKQITKVSLTHPLITLAVNRLFIVTFTCMNFAMSAKSTRRMVCVNKSIPRPHTERVLLLRGHYCLCLTYHCLVDSAIGLRIRMHRYLLISFQWEGESACNLSWDVRHRACVARGTLLTKTYRAHTKMCSPWLDVTEA